MGQIKGAKEWKKFNDGDSLSRKQAILAHCFECNGYEDSNADCQAKKCALYQHHPHKNKRKRTSALS